MLTYEQWTKDLELTASVYGTQEVSRVYLDKRSHKNCRTYQEVCMYFAGLSLIGGVTFGAVPPHGAHLHAKETAASKPNTV